MAGSYSHATDRRGRLLSAERMARTATETSGDAYETVEEFYGMVWFLAEGDAARVEEAAERWREGIALSPGRTDDGYKE